MSGVVEPRLFKGLRDLLPEEMQARQWMLDTIRGVYESYGYVPLATPAIEYLDVLTGSAGQEANESIFRVIGPEKDEQLGLRFDLTVPLARVVAQYVDLPRPFRRYQVATVYRGDHPTRGRYREFTQFDIDAVGVESELADVEALAVMCDALAALRVGPHRVRFSSRRVLNLVLPFAGIAADRAHDVFRVLDKLDKLGNEKVRLELTTGYKDESGSTVPGLGFTNAQVDQIEQFLAIRADARGEVIAQARELLGGVPDSAAELDALERISAHLAALGYGDDRVRIDLSIARGLAYYTSTVYECNLLDAPQYGAIASGGRYDNLVARFLGERVPAVGASIGVDRLLAALVELGRVPLRKATAQVLITTMDPGLMSDYLAMAHELRRAGVRTELYLGMEKRFGKQTRYGDQYGIPLVVIVGSNESAKGVVIVKDMTVMKENKDLPADRRAFLKSRPGQVETPRGELVATVKRLLAEIEGA